MSAVQSSITIASASWLEQMIQVGKEHSEAMPVAQLRHTQEANRKITVPKVCLLGNYMSA